jgi:hypothetical protein
MPRRPTPTEWNRFFKVSERRIESLFREYATGAFDTAELHDRFATILAERHGRAGYIGRRRAGDFAAFDEDDTKFGELIAEEEEPFIGALMEDLRGGRYLAEDGSFLLAAILSRADYYAGKLVATANEAFTGVSDLNELYRWELAGEEDHCPDCPDLAAGSPYRSDDLPTHPCSGETKCLTNCLCRLVRVSDGLTSFTRP